MNSHLDFPAPAPLQSCCLPVAAGTRPESFDPAPDLNEAMMAFVQAAGVLARSLAAFALAPAKRRRVAHASVHQQSLPGDAIETSPQAPLVLARSSRAILMCEKGTIWITQGDGSDYVLTAGERLALAPRDKVIVKAMRGAAQVRCLDR